MQVSGKCIECPFHGWLFDGETGKCVKIPYSKGKVPDQAKVKAWPTLEVNGRGVARIFGKRGQTIKSSDSRAKRAANFCVPEATPTN